MPVKAYRPICRSSWSSMHQSLYRVGYKLVCEPRVNTLSRLKWNYPAEMNDCKCCKHSIHDRENVDTGRRGHIGIMGRQALVVAIVVIACILQSVLLARVCSYVHHELTSINSQVHQVMRHCRCSRHPLVGRLSHAVSPLQVSIGTETTQRGKLIFPSYIIPNKILPNLQPTVGETCT